MTNVKRGITIANNLRWLRKLHGYTQKQMAEMLNIPLGTYAVYENISSGIGKERLQLLCNFWGVKVEHLEMEPEAFQARYREGIWIW